PQPAALDGDEARAEALYAREILVARGLVDLALASFLDRYRLHREAVRLRAAVAAAFAHHLVDDRAQGGIRIRIALAPPALLRGAGLVVDERRNPGRGAQLALDGVELVAMADRHAVRPRDPVRILLRLVRDDDDRLHAFGRELPRDHRRIERAVVALAARHGDRVVVEDLVGHVDLGGHRGADREQAGVEIRAVAEIREDVLLVGEGRLADPGRALCAHVREGGRAAVHPHGHEVAADSGRGPASFGDARRRVVRAAGAEVGLPDRGDARFREQLLLEVEEREPFPELAPQARRHVQLGKPLRDHPRHHRGRVLVVRGQQPGSRGLAFGAAPFAVVVELADDARRAHAFLPVVELFLDLVLDDLALLLDDEDLLEALGEAPRDLRLERP